jgi:hypothetical protein
MFEKYSVFAMPPLSAMFFLTLKLDVNLFSDSLVYAIPSLCCVNISSCRKSGGLKECGKCSL